MIEYLNSLFYGDNWYISWGIILIIVVVGLALQLPPIIKSIKEKKNK